MTASDHKRHDAKIFPHQHKFIDHTTCVTSCMQGNTKVLKLYDGSKKLSWLIDTVCVENLYF